MKDPFRPLNARWDRRPVPVVATRRRKEYGGEFTGSLEDEVRILETAARNGAKWVDIRCSGRSGSVPT